MNTPADTFKTTVGRESAIPFDRDRGRMSMGMSTSMGREADQSST